MSRDGFFAHSIDHLRKFMHGNHDKAKQGVSDSEGHYDIDGVSMASKVVVASDGNTKENGSLERQYLPLDEKSLQEILNQADATSIKLKNQRAPSEDGIIDKKDQFSSATYSREFEEYLEFEKAGD